MEVGVWRRYWNEGRVPKVPGFQGQGSNGPKVQGSKGPKYPRSTGDLTLNKVRLVLIIFVQSQKIESRGKTTCSCDISNLYNSIQLVIFDKYSTKVNL